MSYCLSSLFLSASVSKSPSCLSPCRKFARRAQKLTDSSADYTDFKNRTTTLCRPRGVRLRRTAKQGVVVVSVVVVFAVRCCFCRCRFQRNLRNLRNLWTSRCRFFRCYAVVVAVVVAVVSVPLNPLVRVIPLGVVRSLAAPRWLTLPAIEEPLSALVFGDWSARISRPIGAEL